MKLNRRLKADLVGGGDLLGNAAPTDKFALPRKVARPRSLAYDLSTSYHHFPLTLFFLPRVIFPFAYFTQWNDDPLCFQNCNSISIFLYKQLHFQFGFQVENYIKKYKKRFFSDFLEIYKFWIQRYLNFSGKINLWTFLEKSKVGIHWKNPNWDLFGMIQIRISLKKSKCGTIWQNPNLKFLEKSKFDIYGKIQISKFSKNLNLELPGKITN